MVSTTWIGENAKTIDRFERYLQYELSLQSISILQEDGFKAESVKLIDSAIVKVEDNKVILETILECHNYQIVYLCELDLILLRKSDNLYRASVTWAALTYTDFYREVKSFQYNGPILYQYYPKKEKL